MSAAFVSLISGGGIVLVTGALGWTWKLASVLAELATAIRTLRSVFDDHETRLRNVERRRDR